MLKKYQKNILNLATKILLQTNCKVPSEGEMSFIKNYNKNPKGMREFLKNPVIK